MKITQLRNATLIIEFGEVRLLVDPMLAAQGQLPALKYLARRRRNPLVELPDNTAEQLQRVTHCLITHCQKGHFDHLDRAGVRWLRERQLPIICMTEDADYLRKLRLNVHQVLPEQMTSPFLGGSVQPIPCLHGEGFIGRMMAHGHGYFIQIAGEPSLYIAGDTLLTADVCQCLTQRAPAVSVLPAGGARFDLGGEIIMGQADILAALQLSGGIIVANHLEALDHCPVTRAGLLQEATRRGLSERLRVPQDGETLEFLPTLQRQVVA
ncbi:MBL fold metallo-hydrolase [Pseudomonas anguilliseptica]|uniref:MBL fold metallo-hydrolase n=1 Tax=Pseudomonas anguilliseptica TaxID=53406 RepID=UPI003736D28F